MKEWKSIFESELAYQASIVQQVLEDRNMQAIVINKKDHAHNIGHFEVHVPDASVLKAAHIVKNEIQFDKPSTES